MLIIWIARFDLSSFDIWVSVNITDHYWIYDNGNQKSVKYNFEYFDLASNFIALSDNAVI